MRLTREMLDANTTIIDGSSDKRRLQMKEALHILYKKPSMNIQIGSTSIPLPSFHRDLYLDGLVRWTGGRMSAVQLLQTARDREEWRAMIADVLGDMAPR